MPDEGIVPSFSPQTVRKAGIQGGALAGFSLALFVIVFKNVSGFADLPQHLFSNLWPLIIFNGTLAGAATGYICSHYAIVLKRQVTRRRKTGVQATLLFSGFIISVLVQQLSARSALRQPVWNETLGRLHGGPLGEPNFETIATGVIGGVYFLSLTRMLSTQLPQQRASWLLTTIRTILPAIVSWSGVYFIYVMLTAVGIMSKYDIPWKSQAIFIVDFPYPERVILYIIFCFIFTIFMILALNRNLQAPSKNSSHKDQAFLDSVSKSVEHNLADPQFGPEQLAKDLGISKGHLNRRLNDIAHTNTTNFILSARLAKAAELLQHDFDSVSRIAYSVGFNNLSYFNKCFKQHYNITPSEFKKQRL